MPLTLTAANIFIGCALVTLWATKPEQATQARLVATVLLVLAAII
jgi:hypothetical protein